MGRHFVFRAKLAKFQARLCLCHAFHLLMSPKVLLYHCRMKTSAGWCSGPGCLFLCELFYCICPYFSCFVETDIFPSPHHIFISLSSYQMAENKIHCVSWHISTTPYPESEGFQCITNRFMGIWCQKTYAFIQELFHKSTTCPALKFLLLLLYIYIINCTHILFCIPKELPDVMCSVCTDGWNADLFHCPNASTSHCAHSGNIWVTSDGWHLCSFGCMPLLSFNSYSEDVGIHWKMEHMLLWHFVGFIYFISTIGYFLFRGIHLELQY